MGTGASRPSAALSMNLLQALRSATRAALGSLKLRITLGVMVALMLGAGLSTLVLVTRAEQDMLAAVRDRELEEAVRTASMLSRRVVELQRALQTSGQQLDPAALDDPSTLQDFLQRQPVLRSMFSGIYIARPDGEVQVMFTAGSFSRRPLSLADRGYFQRCVKEQRAVISEPLQSRLDGDVLVVFVQPLMQAGRVIGVLGGTLNLAKRDMLADLVSPSSDQDEALRVVTDGRGRILAHPNRALVLSPMSVEPRMVGAARRWHASGSPVEPSGLSLTQDAEIVSAGGVAGPDWVVWRVVDEARLLGPLRSARGEAMTSTAGLIAAITVFVLIGLWWLLRPLRQLEERAGRLLDDHEDPLAGWPRAGGEIGRLVAVLQRVGVERSALEHSKRELLTQLRSVMGNAPVGIAFTRDQRFELVSDELCRLLGRSEAELLGQPAVIIYDSPEDYAALGPKVGAAFAAGQAYVGDVPMRRADGRRFWAHLRGRPVDAANSLAGTIWTVTDVTNEVAARTRLEWSASHDLLTGLANRQVFEQRLALAFEKLPASLPTAVVMIDLDQFKPVNDRAGHAAGDAMLQAVADALRDRVRSHDLAVRLGGDEFALLLDHCPHEAAMHIADEVLATISQIVLPWGEHRLEVGASLGVASLTADMPSVAAWLRAADEACYAAKAAGRGQVRAAPLVRPPLRVVGGANP